MNTHINTYVIFQAANQFSSALTSGQMGPVISQFGLPSEVSGAANTGDMQAFFKALENTSADKPKDDDKKKEEKPKDDKGDKKDDDAEMSLDWFEINYLVAS